MIDIRANRPVRQITARRRILRSPSRTTLDRWSARALFLLTLPTILLLLAIIAALALRSAPLLRDHSPWQILTGSLWKPAQGQFGLLPFVAGTVWVTAVSMVLAVPPCLLASIYLAEYVQPQVRAAVWPLLDLLGAIPSVVYGVWGVLTVVPAVQALTPALSHRLSFLPLFTARNPTGYGVLSGGIVLAVMVAPVIIPVAVEVLRAVPQGLREASLAMGATRWQTVRHAVLPRALPGLAAAVALGFSRAFGETMAVVMVVGNVPEVPRSLFDPAYPLTALIANNYGEMLTIPRYDALLLGAALVLLLVVLGFNLLSRLVLHHIGGRSEA